MATNSSIRRSGYLLAPLDTLHNDDMIGPWSSSRVCCCSSRVVRLTHSRGHHADDWKPILIALTLYNVLVVLVADNFTVESLPQETAFRSFHILDSCYPIWNEFRRATTIHDVVETQSADILERWSLLSDAVTHAGIIFQFPRKSFKGLSIHA